MERERESDRRSWERFKSSQLDGKDKHLFWDFECSQNGHFEILKFYPGWYMHFDIFSKKSQLLLFKTHLELENSLKTNLEQKAEKKTIQFESNANMSVSHCKILNYDLLDSYVKRTREFIFYWKSEYNVENLGTGQKNIFRAKKSPSSSTIDLIDRSRPITFWI